MAGIVLQHRWNGRYSMSQKAYVMIPDQTTVDKAKTLMKKVREGFMLSEADVAR